MVKVDGATPLPKDGIKRRTFHCHLSMCEFIRRNLRFFFGGEREDSSPKLRDARALRSISTSPACGNGNAPCTDLGPVMGDVM